MNPSKKLSEFGLMMLSARLVRAYINGDRDRVVRQITSFPPAVASYVALTMVTLAGAKGVEMNRALSCALVHRFTS
jgi:predicted permease